MRRRQESGQKAAVRKHMANEGVIQRVIQSITPERGKKSFENNLSRVHRAEVCTEGLRVGYGWSTYSKAQFLRRQ